MKTALIAIIVVIAAVALIAAVSSKSSSPSTATTAAAFGAVKTDISKGGKLLDVRTDAEYAARHIEGAQHLSLQALQAGSRPDVDTTKPLYVYCRSGNRSATAAKILRQAGYTDVKDLGGMSSVQKMGGEVTKL